MEVRRVQVGFDGGFTNDPDSLASQLVRVAANRGETLSECLSVMLKRGLDLEEVFREPTTEEPMGEVVMVPAEWAIVGEELRYA